ncbi:MAG: site-2 protease family protein [Bacteroidota bacterium]
MQLTAKRLLIHATLFILTFLTTTLAGVQWLNRDPYEIANFDSGLTYAIPLLAILLSHEFGHYIAARYHGVSATLPYFLPFPAFLFGIAPFGTLGAVIRIQSRIESRKSLFDIGSAGPVAGFVVSLIILIVGFRTLPNLEYLYTIHPEYRSMAGIPESGLTFGGNILLTLLSKSLAPSGSFVPPMNEIYHYPFLCVGWFGMLVTAMNLIPVGQLDGGHITYAMFGSMHHRISQISLLVLVVLGTLGFLPLIGINLVIGWSGWLFWALVLALLIRSRRFERPPLDDLSPLTPGRKLVGWLCVVIFVTTFIPVPITI